MLTLLVVPALYRFFDAVPLEHGAESGRSEPVAVH
jgi:hypothetical protein